MPGSVGVIAEDVSDVEVVKILINKIRTDKNFSVKKFVGHGCGRVRSKCKDWAQNLRQQGCTSLILLHDLDRNNLEELKRTLENLISPCAISAYIIVIPVRELEAWLLCDPLAIKKTFNLQKTPKDEKRPEQIQDPKKHIGELVYKLSNKEKRFINTVHNEKIAQNMQLSSLTKCKSFAPFAEFIRQSI